MSRWKAAGIHLSISLLIGLIVLTLLFVVWYPAPYFRATGGQDLTLILLGVDLVLGPLLTLVVFKSGKKSLRFDLGVIAALQIGALLYGLNVIVQARPAFIVAAIDRFTLVAANELEPDDLAKGSKPEFSTLSWTGPRLVAARLPEDPAQRTEIMLDAAAGGADIERRPATYVDYASEAANLLTRAKPLDVLRAKSAEAARIIDQWLAKQARSESEFAWLPINARNASLSMIVDAKSGAVIEALPIDPW